MALMNKVGILVALIVMFELAAVLGQIDCCNKCVRDHRVCMRKRACNQLSYRALMPLVAFAIGRERCMHVKVDCLSTICYGCPLDFFF